MENYEEFYKTICRVCLSHENTKNMVSLTNNSDNFELSCYGEALQIFTQVRIKNDNLPNNMCQQCLYLLQQAILLKKKCENSQKLLSNFLQNTDFSKTKIKEKISEFILYKQYFPEECIKSSSKTRNLTEKDIKKRKQRKISRDKIKQEKMTIKELLDDFNDLFDDDIQEDNILDTKSDKETDKIEESDEELLNKMEKLVNVHTSFPSDIEMDYESETNNLDKSDKETDKIEERDEKLLNEMDKLVNVHSSFPSDIEIDYESEANNLNDETFSTVYKKRKQKQNVIKQQRRKKNMTCDICNKVLANLNTYKCHMQRHNGYQYVCEHCAKGYATLAELQYHLASSHNIGQHYICNKCGYKAFRKYDLKEHDRCHTGERPFACDKCGLTFRRRFVWKKHLIYHMEKTVQCPLCPRKFHRREELRAHSNNVHERVYIYSCSECDITYAKTSTVRRHLAEKHGINREMQGKIKRIIIGKSSVK